MRFYRIEITDISGNPVLIGGIPMIFSSHDDADNYKRGSLQVEFDIPVVTADIPAGNGFVKIWGISLETLNQASSLNLMNIRILAGMKKGLPLANEQVSANPPRNGTIFEGTIYQAFGNWQGTEQSLDLIVTTQLAAKPQDASKNAKPIVFNCPTQASFQSAISQAMASAGITSNVNVNPNIVAPEPIIFAADNINLFARELNRQSQQVMKDPNYIGIKTIKTPLGYDCTDNTVQDAPRGINFNDLIGQPTWLDLLIVQMKVVMRSDLYVGATVNMPQAILTNRARVFGAAKEGIAFAGTGFVNQVRHVGNSRQADANSWVTIVDSILNLK